MKKSRRKRGVFSTDVAIATLVLMTIAFVCVLSLNSTARSLAWDSRLGLAESSALRLADFMLKDCGPPALSECDAQFAYSHILSRSKAGALAANWPQFESLRPGKKMAVKILGLDGKTIAEAGSIGTNAACVRRVALLEGKEVILEACSE